MSIAEEGFLSPDVARFIGMHREANKAAFNLADALNRTAQRLMLGSQVRVEGDVLNENNLAQLLFVRAVSNFQGTVLMAERGAVVEARTLARTCLESLVSQATVSWRLPNSSRLICWLVVPRALANCSSVRPFASRSARRWFKGVLSQSVNQATSP